MDNPETISRWKERDPYEVWSAYFDRLTRAAESGLFEIIGHADLPKKFKIYPKQDCSPLFQRFLETAQRKNVAIELNTAGLRKDCREIYPSRAFLELAAHHKTPDHLRLRRPRAGRGGPRVQRSGRTGPRRGLHPLASILAAVERIESPLRNFQSIRQLSNEFLVFSSVQFKVKL